MSVNCVCRDRTSAYECDVARLWWASSPGCLLPLSTGGVYRLLCTGRPGGAWGPDVRDAVLVPATDRSETALPARLVGDVEFHVRASDWVAHQHHTDARYNAVILHVVFVCDTTAPTVRQDGVVVPTCSLYDLPLTRALTLLQQSEGLWPCQRIVPLMDEVTLERLLQRAGLQRFEQKAHAFVEQLHVQESYDLVLLPSLAEGLGYGRDRAFFRAIGLYLAGGGRTVPDPAGRALQPTPLDRQRLRVLFMLHERWRVPGIWRTLSVPLTAGTDEADTRSLLQTLQASLVSLGLSRARADILICNVVLPFALAVALLEHNSLLASRAQACYVNHPGLPSNQVTRMMRAQLKLSSEPRGSCQQQGLHHIYQQACREKRCEICMFVSTSQVEAMYW